MEVFESEMLMLWGMWRDGSSSTLTFLFVYSGISQSRELLQHCYMVAGSQCSDVGLHLSRPRRYVPNGTGWESTSTCHRPLPCMASNTIVKAIICTLLYVRAANGVLQAFSMKDGMKSRPGDFLGLGIRSRPRDERLCCLSKVARKTESCAHHTNLHCRLFIMQASVLALTITHNVPRVPFSLISVLDNG